MAIWATVGPLFENACIPTAPMMAGRGDPYEVISHEIGHCLGLSHTYEDGEEYATVKDIMGGPYHGGRPCPSNLNAEALKTVWALPGLAPQEWKARVIGDAIQAVPPIARGHEGVQRALGIIHDQVHPHGVTDHMISPSSQHVTPRTTKKVGFHPMNQ